VLDISQMERPVFFKKIQSFLPDVFLFGGLCLLGYGLFLFSPWVSFAICGVLLMAIGLFMGLKE